MRKAVFTILILFIGGMSFAQRFPSQIWHPGKLVLLEGDTLKGEVMYNQETDLIQYTDNSQRTIQTFTARKLLFFEIFDDSQGSYRQFYSIPFNLSGDYKAPIIFELIREGANLTMLSREAIENKIVTYPYAVGGTYTRTELVYTYFFLKPDGSITRFNGKKKELIWLMRKKSDQIKKYIKSEGLRMDRRSDLVKLVAYYNSLFDNA